MRSIQNVAVFCASARGANPLHAEWAYQTGHYLASKGIGVVYGGSRNGLMGQVANGALDAGGKVIGILPDFMGNKEIAHEGLTELIMVKSMHERKLLMHQHSDAVLALPGGFGTLEELFEMLTWAQLGLHQKPMVLLNNTGYFSHLLAFIAHMTSQGLLKVDCASMLLVADTLEEVLEKMITYKAPEVDVLLRQKRT